MALKEKNNLMNKLYVMSATDNNNTDIDWPPVLSDCQVPQSAAQRQDW